MKKKKKNKKRKQKSPIFRKLLKIITVLFIAAAAFGFAIYLLVLFGAFGKIPDAKELAAIQNSTASHIYSSDGVILGKYYTQNRTNATFNELSPFLVNALLATEDIRFFEHKGFDKRSFLRVLFKSILLQQKQYGGGSTITQQLVKNIYPREYRFGRFSVITTKIKEVILARRMERLFTKGEIMALYLNTIELGYNTFGIKSACEFYFSASPSDINPENAALIVGMLKAPTAYNPRRNPDRAVSRRNVVLNQMKKYELISAHVADSLKGLPIKLKLTKRGHNDGIATYFREQLRQELREWCNNNPKEDGTKYNIYNDGLKIYTTINASMQEYAEKAVEDHMKALQKSFNNHWSRSKPWDRNSDILNDAIQRSEEYRSLKDNGTLSEKEITARLNEPVEVTIFSYEGEVTKRMSPIDVIKHNLMHLHTGFIAMDPHTGNVLAYVGGINHRYFKYNHVLSKRQVGSTFKPIVYASALQQGAAPCDLIANDSIVYTEYQDWSPKNVQGYGGWYSLKGGLTNSVNTISVKLIMESGLYNVTNLAKKMGITSSIPAKPSIALGAADISLQEMVTAYGTFSNRGISIQPTYLIKIEDAAGNVLADFTKTKKHQRVLSRDDADIMTDMLQSVVDSGTARRLRTRYGLKNSIAGKTGTTQSHADGWFIGFTPNILAGVWVGGADRRVHFRSISLGQGANMALPIWAKFVQKLNSDPDFKSSQFVTFPEPSIELLSQIDCPLYLKEIQKPTFANKKAYDEYKRKQKELKKNPGFTSDPVIVRTSESQRPKKKERFVDKLKGLFKKNENMKKKKRSKN